MRKIDHGFGAEPTATTSPDQITFTEKSEARAARSVYVKNVGSAAVKLLVNTPTDGGSSSGSGSGTAALQTLFDSCTPVILNASEEYTFTGDLDGSGPWFRNIAYVAASGSSALRIRAF
jgi:hypothetical protein